MRFDKDARAAIYEAAPHPVTIKWPRKAGQPREGGIYWLQSEEDAQKERERREHSPETHAEVMAGMHKRFYGTEPQGATRRRRRSIGRPRAGDPRIIVLDTTILDVGWEARVQLYEDPDPVRHLRVGARVPAGPNPIEGYHEPAELEPEQMPPESTHQRRREEEEAMAIEHKASVDRSEIMKAERRLADQRRRGKSGKLAAQAAERARKRAREQDAEVSAGAAV